jgi:Cu-processing system ATP-binding protein
MSETAIETAIETVSLGKRFGAQAALEDVGLAVPAGTCLALLGHNGAGKTTLMKLLLGLGRPTSGSVRVLGVDPAGRESGALRRALGFLPENIAFHDAMTGREVLGFYARLKGAAPRSGAALLERVGLAAAADRRAKTYSKGMRQRLGLAQAMLGSPRLVLLDEPTTGLDPIFRASFYELIHDLTASGATVLLSSHALTELEARTDAVAILRQGRLVAHGTLAELRRAAALRARIRVAVPAGSAKAFAAGLGAAARLERVNDRSVELSCALEEKLALLRALSGLAAPIEDIEVAPPSLDEVYAHYSGAQAAS